MKHGQANSPATICSSFLSQKYDFISRFKWTQYHMKLFKVIGFLPAPYSSYVGATSLADEGSFSNKLQLYLIHASAECLQATERNHIPFIAQIVWTLHIVLE